MTKEQISQDANEGTMGPSRSTVGLERMFRVAKTDHPDFVGGIVWADCELAWINERITLAILAEREACAKACEAIGPELIRWWGDGQANAAAQECATVIRMRSNVGVHPRRQASGGTKG